MPEDVTRHDCFERIAHFAPWITAALVAICFGYRLGDGRLSGTEGHRAIPAMMMVHTGDWILPHMFEQVYLRKPPAQYWAIGAAIKLFGEHEWVFRLPSLLFAMGTGVVVCVFGRRWFGSLGGLAAGLSFFCTLALWSQPGNADIDAANTFASVLTACALLEMSFADKRIAWGWSITAGLGLALLLLAKGPAGLPLVIGVILGASLAQWRWRWLIEPKVIHGASLAKGRGYWPISLKVISGARLAKWRWLISLKINIGLSLAQWRKQFSMKVILGASLAQWRWRWLIGPRMIVSMIVGVGLAGWWVYAVWQRLEALGLHADLRGASEAGASFLAIERLPEAFLAQVELVIYSLPIGAVFVLCLIDMLRSKRTEGHPRVTLNIAPSHQRQVRSLVLTSLVAMLVLMINGITNPRYGYMILPLFSLLVAAGAQAWQQGRLNAATQRTFRQIMTVTLAAVVGIHLVMTFELYPASDVKPLLAIALLASVIIGALGVAAWLRRRVARALVLTVAGFAVLTVVMNEKSVGEDRANSGYEIAQTVRQLVPARAGVTFGDLAWDKPELAWYTGLPLHNPEPRLAPPVLFDQPRWLLLSHEEYRSWQRRAGERITLIARLREQGSGLVLVRYTPAGDESFGSK